MASNRTTETVVSTDKRMTNNPTVQTSSFNAADFTHYMVNTGGGPITATLPASPATHSKITFTDVTGSIDATNYLRIARNGNNIINLAQDFDIVIGKTSYTFFYSGANGWIILDNAPNLLDASVGSYMRRKNGLTQGSTNTNVVIYGTAAESNGTDITYVNSATLGDSFTVNTNGIYSISVSSTTTSTGSQTQIKVGTLDNTGGGSEARAFISNSGGAGWESSIAWTGYIAAGESIWTWCGSAPTGADVDENQITIAKVG